MLSLLKNFEISKMSASNEEYEELICDMLNTHDDIRNRIYGTIVGKKEMGNLAAKRTYEYISKKRIEEIGLDEEDIETLFYLLNDLKDRNYTYNFFKSHINGLLSWLRSTAMPDYLFGRLDVFFCFKDLMEKEAELFSLSDDTFSAKETENNKQKIETSFDGMWVDSEWFSELSPSQIFLLSEFNTIEDFMRLHPTIYDILHDVFDEHYDKNEGRELATRYSRPIPSLRNNWFKYIDERNTPYGSYF